MAHCAKDGRQQGTLAHLLCSVLVLLVLTGTGGCGGEIELPEPVRPRYETDYYRIKPGKNVLLRVAPGPGVRPNTISVQNMEPFVVTLLDDIWLKVHAPNVVTRTSGPYIKDNYVELHCPAPSSIPANSVIEISLDTCAATTYEPGPGARITNFRVVAREGFMDTHIDPGFHIVPQTK